MALVNLMYHDIVSSIPPDKTGFLEPGANHYKIADKAFRSHLAALEHALNSDCDIDLVDHLEGRSEANVTLSFDDGGVGAMSALECLSDFKRKGHFLIATGFVGKPGFLTRSDIREIANCGHTIGSHSHTHLRDMMHKPNDLVVEEWSTSINFLEDTIGEKIDVASVPYGSYSPKVALSASRAGIRHLFTSEPTTRSWTVDSTSIYGRYAVTQDTSDASVVALVENKYLARQIQWANWNARKMAKTVFASAYAKTRSILRPS